MIDYHMFQSEIQVVGEQWQQPVSQGISPQWIYEVLQRAAREEAANTPGSLAANLNQIWRDYASDIEALNLTYEEKQLVSRNAARHVERFKTK